MHSIISHGLTSSLPKFQWLISSDRTSISKKSTNCRNKQLSLFRTRRWPRTTKLTKNTKIYTKRKHWDSQLSSRMVLDRLVSWDSPAESVLQIAIYRREHQSIVTFSDLLTAMPVNMVHHNPNMFWKASNQCCHDKAKSSCVWKEQWKSSFFWSILKDS